MSLKGLDVKRLFLIGGIEGIIGGMLGAIAFVWDYYSPLFYTQIEDIAFTLLSVVVIATGAFVLWSKKSVTVDMASSKYTGTYWN